MNQILNNEIIKEFKGTEEMEKYKEKVQEYTNYDIGRKIPETATGFTEEEIKRGYLIVKSPEILRIITKWCEELWKKFEDENYYIDRSEGLVMIGSRQVNSLNSTMKSFLQ